MAWCISSGLIKLKFKMEGAKFGKKKN